MAGREVVQVALMFAPGPVSRTARQHCAKSQQFITGMAGREVVQVALMFAPGPVGPRVVQGGTAQRRLYEGLWRTALALRCESTKRVRPRRIAHAKVARRTGCKTTARRAGHTGARVAAHESQTRTPQTPGPQDTILSYIKTRGTAHAELFLVGAIPGPHECWAWRIFFLLVSF